MAKQISTYRKEIARLRARLPQAKRASTLHAMRRQIRELAAVMSGRRSGEWHEITIEEACQITGEKDGLPRRFF
jgi:hypothetical protein